MVTSFSLPNASEQLYKKKKKKEKKKQWSQNVRGSEIDSLGVQSA